jgi:hypothetical protein
MGAQVAWPSERCYLTSTKIVSCQKKESVVNKLTMVCMVRHVKERATSSFAPKSSRTRIRMSSGREVRSITGSLLASVDGGVGAVCFEFRLL